MAVICPGRKTRMIMDVFAFILCMLVTIGQLAILDFYFLHYLNDNIWYTWIAGDVLVLIVFIALLIIAIRYNQRCMNKECPSDANIKYAFLAWLVYSLVLAGKVAVTFRLFYDQIQLQSVDQEEHLKQIFGRHTYKLALSLSAVVFLLLVEAHHYTRLNSPRQLYLSYLSSAVTFDLLDSILFLELLWADQLWVKMSGDQKFALQITILVLACFNFVLPTFALMKLRFRKMPRWLPLPYEKMYALIYVLVVNVPYLVIRSYLWKNVPDHDVSIFLVKNAIFIYLGVRDVWTRVQYYRQKKADENAALNRDENHSPLPDTAKLEEKGASQPV